MTLGEWAFKARHIPGSLIVSRLEDAQTLLQPEDEIVVYCSDVHCIASQAAYKMLVSKGYQNVRRYAGGIADWQAVGFAVESAS